MENCSRRIAFSKRRWPEVGSKKEGGKPMKNAGPSVENPNLNLGRYPVLIRVVGIRVTSISSVKGSCPWSLRVRKFIKSSGGTKYPGFGMGCFTAKAGKHHQWLGFD